MDSINIINLPESVVAMLSDADRPYYLCLSDEQYAGLLATVKARMDEWADCPRCPMVEERLRYRVSQANAYRSRLIALGDWDNRAEYKTDAEID